MGNYSPLLQRRDNRRDNQARGRGGFRSGERASDRRRQNPAQSAAKQGKNQKTIKVAEIRKDVGSKKMLVPSDRRLKVRNIDEKQVTNEDLTKLFAKRGELAMCRFDRNSFGQFLGSATVTFKNPADAKAAINEYDGCLLDDKVILVEYDMVPARQRGPAKGGRTLRVN